MVKHREPAAQNYNTPRISDTKLRLRSEKPLVEIILDSAMFVRDRKAASEHNPKRLTVSHKPRCESSCKDIKKCMKEFR